MMPPEIVQAIIIAVGLIIGIMTGTYLLERRVEGKVAKYWQKIKSSKEGQDLFTILKELRDLLKSGETQKLFKESEELMSEFRAVLKMIKERTTQSPQEDDGEGPVFPKLESPST